MLAMLSILARSSTLKSGPAQQTRNTVLSLGVSGDFVGTDICCFEDEAEHSSFSKFVRQNLLHEHRLSARVRQPTLSVTRKDIINKNTSPTVRCSFQVPKRDHRERSPSQWIDLRPHHQRIDRS
jgi:hypothetical protein